MKNTDIFWKEEILFIIDAVDYKHIWVVNMISFLFCLGIRRVFYFPIFYVVRKCMKNDLQSNLCITTT